MKDPALSPKKNSPQNRISHEDSPSIQYHSTRGISGRRLRHPERKRRTDGTDFAEKNGSACQGNGSGSELHVICIYPNVQAGKLARRWIEEALSSVIPRGLFQIEYFNYDVLSHNGISWGHIRERFHPDIIMMLCDGKHPLDGGLRHSLRDLFHQEHNEKKPLVLFKDLEAEPSLNARTILDYLSVLSLKNHCELNALNGNGGAISSFRHPRLLLRGRQYRE